MLISSVGLLGGKKQSTDKDYLPEGENSVYRLIQKSCWLRTALTDSYMQSFKLPQKINTLPKKWTLETQKWVWAEFLPFPGYR